MKGSKATVLNIAQRCKNIMASNWQAHLNTIKADAKGSKDDIYTSKVKYILKKGRPYIWVPEKDMHNVNTVIDERGSVAITSPFPGPLSHLLRSMNKLPARIALTGEVVPLRDEKMKVKITRLNNESHKGVFSITLRVFQSSLAQLATESVKDVILSEQRAMKEFSYTVSGVLSSSNLITTSRSENLKQLVDGSEKYRVYRFNMSTCMYIDGHGRSHEVELEDMEKSKAEPLASFSARLIDGINQSEARCRALILLCFLHMNANAKDAYILSIDCKGFDVLAKIPSPSMEDGSSEYQWKEFRFKFQEEAPDIETFCCRLVEMEEDAVKKVSSYSGLA